MSRADSDWGSWLSQRMELLGFRTNRMLAAASGVPESVISRWRNQGRLPSVEQLRLLRSPLQATMIELLVASGQLTRDEAQMRDIPPPAPAFRGTAEAIAADPELDDELRLLLLSQYRAMVAVARARTTQAR